MMGLMNLNDKSVKIAGKTYSNSDDDNDDDHQKTKKKQVFSSFMY